MQPTVNRRVKLTVNGKAYVVEVGDLEKTPISVNVNGQPYLVTIATDDLEIVPADAAMATHHANRDTGAPEKVAKSTAPAGPNVTAVKSPMPGNVLDIQVKPGDKVSFKQQLCSLEAMKMKNAIRSPRDGIIATVEISEGQAVAHGEVLFTFE